MKRLALGLSVAALLAGCSTSGPNDPSVNQSVAPVASQAPDAKTNPSPRRQMVNPSLGHTNQGGGSNDKL
jgi:ABC-type uncharacterized transport system auxiliary subunit